MPRLPFKFDKSYFLWGTIYEQPYEDGGVCQINDIFDYETKHDGTKCLYIDISCKYNYAWVVQRSVFKVWKTQTWNDIFIENYLRPIIQKALEEGIEGYHIYCIANGLENPTNFPDINKIIDMIVKEFLKKYESCKKNDEANAFFLNTMKVKWSSVGPYQLMLQSSFSIMDEVLFYHPDFDHEHNREIFSSYVPLQCYATLKQNCKAISSRSVVMNGVQLVFFYYILDCAMQMMFIPKADQLLSELEKQGFDTDDQLNYTSVGTYFFNQLKTTFKESNISIANINKPIDWLNLIQ
jgi:hypothetical protein